MSESIRLTKTEEGDSWADAALAMLANMSKRDLIENASVMARKIGELAFRIRWATQRFKVHT